MQLERRMASYQPPHGRELGNARPTHHACENCGQSLHGAYKTELAPLLDSLSLLQFKTWRAGICKQVERTSVPHVLEKHKLEA